MIGDVKMQTIKRRTGRSLTGDRPLFLALRLVVMCNGRSLVTRTGDGELERHSSHTKDLSFQSNIYKPARWLCSGRMLCEQFPCPNGELNVLGPLSRTLIDNSST